MAGTGTYQINNTNLPSPTTAKWVIPEVRGENGDGMKRYEKYFKFEVGWNLLSQTEFNGLVNLWNGHFNSGTAVVNLPQYPNTLWYFHEYSGTYVDRPEFGRYDNTYLMDVRITIRKIKVA